MTQPEYEQAKGTIDKNKKLIEQCRLRLQENKQKLETTETSIEDETTILKQQNKSIAKLHVGVVKLMDLFKELRVLDSDGNKPAYVLICENLGPSKIERGTEREIEKLPVRICFSSPKRKYEFKTECYLNSPCGDKETLADILIRNWGDADYTIEFAFPLMNVDINIGIMKAFEGTHFEQAVFNCIEKLKAKGIIA